MTRISVKDASEMLSIPQQAVRVLMQKNQLPIGFIYEGDGGMFTYVIYRERVEKFMEGDL